MSDTISKTAKTSLKTTPVASRRKKQLSADDRSLSAYSVKRLQVALAKNSFHKKMSAVCVTHVTQTFA